MRNLLFLWLMFASTYCHPGTLLEKSADVAFRARRQAGFASTQDCEQANQIKLDADLTANRLALATKLAVCGLLVGVWAHRAFRRNLAADVFGRPLPPAAYVGAAALLLAGAGVFFTYIYQLQTEIVGASYRIGSYQCEPVSARGK